MHAPLDRINRKHRGLKMATQKLQGNLDQDNLNVLQEITKDFNRNNLVAEDRNRSQWYA